MSLFAKLNSIWPRRGRRPKSALMRAWRDRAGLIEARRSRQTGLIVSLYRCAAAGFGEDGGPYATLCEEHGQITNHATLRLARDHLADPCGWCEVCNENERTLDTEASS